MDKELREGIKRSLDAMPENGTSISMNWSNDKTDYWISITKSNPTGLYQPSNVWDIYSGSSPRIQPQISLDGVGVLYAQQCPQNP